jgi:hypothetical protein
LHDAVKTLESDPPASPDQLAKAVEASKKAADDFDAKTLTLPPDDAHSLYWTQMLAFAWCVRGWAALESKDLPTAENYLRAAWRLSQDKTSGYQLGRLLEAKGNRAAAAHQYELAHAASAGNWFGSGSAYLPHGINDRIVESYRKFTGKDLTSSALKLTQYNGSLRQELDKEFEIRPLTRTSKLTGEAMFTVAFETGKPPKAYFLNGGKGFEPLQSALQTHPFSPILPAGSKARLLREFRLLCTPYAGCDAYILLPTAIEYTARQVSIDLTPPPPPPGTKVIHIPSEP